MLKYKYAKVNSCHEKHNTKYKNMNKITCNENKILNARVQAVTNTNSLAQAWC